MSARRVEELLALLYVDPEARRRIRRRPARIALSAGLPEGDVDSVAAPRPM